MIGIIRHIFILLFLSGCLQLVRSEITHTYQFHTLSPSGGLGYDGIKSIVQDNDGFVWVLTADELFQFDGYNYKSYSQYITISNDPSPIIYNQLIHSEKYDCLYLATSRGTFIYDKVSNRFECFFTELTNRIYEDRSGRLWISGLSLGIYYPSSRKYTAMNIEGTLCTSNEKNDIYICTREGLYCMKNNQEMSLIHPFTEEMRVTALECRGNNLWILSETKGLFVWDIIKKQLIRQYDFFLSETQNKVPAKCMHIDKAGHFWIGTQQGLYFFNPHTGSYKHFMRDKKDMAGIVNNSIWTIFEDKRENLWLGTYSGGISYLTKNEMDGFQTHTLGEYGFISRPISAFVVDENQVWFGTEGGGVFLYEEEKGITGVYRHQVNRNSLNYDNVKTLLVDKNDNLWIGMYRGGIDCYNKRTGTFKNYNSNQQDKRILSDEVYKCIAEADSGMWVIYQISDAMLTYFSYDTSQSNHYFFGNSNAYKEKRMVDICRDDQGFLWLATYNNIFRFDIRKQKIETIQLPDHKLCYIRSLFFDDKERLLWIGTQNQGLISYQVDTRKYTKFHSFHKFGSVTINSICADDKGNLWLGSNCGLFRFDKQTQLFSRYDQNDGIQGNVFYPNAVCKSNDEKIYFGGTEGFTRIDPEKIHISSFKSNVLFSDLQINNQSVFNQTNYSSIVSQFVQKREVVLSYYQNNLDIELASTNYMLPLKNRYKYRLCGLDDKWIEVDAQRRYISYPKLPTGSYTFEAMATNNDGVWGKCQQIKLLVKPAPWKSWWAYSCYIIVIFLLFYIFYRYRLRNHRLKNEIYLADLHKREQEESHQAKLQFFTNITHDFKTPLTMILGTVDSIEEDKIKIPDIYIDALKNNSSRLLKLVNEVIDFRMVEKSMMKLDVHPGDLNILVHSCVSEIWGYAIKKEIIFRTLTDSLITQQLLFDHHVMEKIIINLLDNAIKYTPSCGRVNIKTYADISDFSTDYVNCYTEGMRKCEDTYWGFVVSDSGVGISADSISKVFERFFRVNDTNTEKHLGSGIGLALVKSLVLLHNGFITLSSRRGEGTDIVVGFPYLNESIREQLQRNEFKEPEVVTIEPESKEILPDYTINDFTVSTKRRILLVEDNDDLRELIKNRLSAHFMIVDAYDGIQALQVLENLTVDIVLSDWMMPNLDGISLCTNMKKNSKWSHIPFILMTVRSSINDQLEGYTSGAEAYIEKPINFKLLISKINNLLILREHFREYYADTYFIDKPEKLQSKEEDEFMERFIGILKREIASTDKNVESIAKEMMMSRRKLLTLVKNYTGKSVVEFIRSYKMRLAARLLVQEGLAVKEIPQLVGIESASYFTKAFKEEFGCSPSVFLSKIKKGTIC